METTKQEHIYHILRNKAHNHQDKEEISKEVVETGT